MAIEILKTARVAKKLTQEAVAELVGLSTSQISRIEGGLRQATLKQAHNLATILDISIEAMAAEGVIEATDKRRRQSIDAHLRDAPDEIFSEVYGFALGKWPGTLSAPVAAPAAPDIDGDTHMGAVRVLRELTSEGARPKRSRRERLDQPNAPRGARRGDQRDEKS
jgi:transcriptional regulator with XRE-family HTH domain